MSTYLSKSFQLSSPLKVEEDKQGIVSILGSDCGQTKAASFRRTLSADMSSKKWLEQNGFFPMKKIASSAQLAVPAGDSSSSSEEDEEYDVNREGKKERTENPRQFDVWSSIIAQKAEEDDAKLPPPYVHPLVKRSASSLNEKSLEICTESLGSESCSDGFSSYPSSETGDADDYKEVQPQKQEEREFLKSFDWEDSRVTKYNYSTTTKKVQPRSFPPPLPSLTRGDAPSLHVHSRRENGRLVLEAVAVQPNNFFQARRQDGRLLLTVLNAPKEKQNYEEEKIGEFEDVFKIFEEDENETANNEEEEDDEEESDEEVKIEREIVVVQELPKLASGVINVHRSALMIKKLEGLENQNPKWSHKFNKTAKMVEVESEPTALPQSLPPLAPAARLISSTPAGAAASVNAYEYFWRTKSSAPSLMNSLIPKFSPLENNSNKPKALEQKELVVLRSCKEPRRSLSIWEPYCIATS